MCRSKSLRAGLGWAQRDLAAYLGVSQPFVFRMEKAKRERGPEARLLNLLEEGIARGVVGPGMTPQAALDRLGLANPQQAAQ